MPEAGGEVVPFAQAARRALTAERIPCTIGIDSGDLLLFELEDGTKDIAGSPVNMCSKMATDCGKPGNIYVTSSSSAGLRLPKHERFKLDVSHVTIEGFVF